MTSFETTKRSFAAHKGHFGRCLKSFNALLDVKPCPTLTSIESSYSRLQKRIDALFSATESMISLLEAESFLPEETIDVKKELDTVTQYYDTLVSEQTKIETHYAVIKGEYTRGNTSSGDVTTPPLFTKPTVRLTALTPPSWNGVKSDFYTWKRKFQHIMREANILDDLTQLCYIQNSNTLPMEYQMYVSDCSNIEEVWSRLEERVPQETIKYEVITQFRRVKPLSSRKSPTILRDFANEISLFSRRMTDLGLSKENYSCIIMQDIYERLDQDTARRYRNKIELMRELGTHHAQEDLDSLCKFIRSEATTLELSTGSFQPFQPFPEKTLPPKKVYAVDGKNTEESIRSDRSKIGCILGCEADHRLIDCENYLKYTVEQRRECIRRTSRCFACLGMNHTARICSKKDSWKCKKCSEYYHHWTLCKEESPGKRVPLNPEVKSFIQYINSEQSLDVKQDIMNNMAIHDTTQSSPLQAVNGIETVKVKDFSPLVLVEVKTSDGSWTKARCFLDTGSNSSLVRLDFAKQAGLAGKGACNIQFGIAGGGIHLEKGEEFEVHIRPINGNEEYLLLTTGIKKPCYKIKPIEADIIPKYQHLEDVKEKLYVDGGEVDILIGLDYAPLVIPEKTVRDSKYPDLRPSVAYTRLGCYIYGALSESSKRCPNDVLVINYISEHEEEEWRSFFYGDVIGVQPSSLCVCGDDEILESSFIKHVRETTYINEEGRVCVKMPWKPGFPEKLPNNFNLAVNQMLRREKQLIRSGKMDDYNKEIMDLVKRKVVRILTTEEARKAADEPAWYLNHRIVERPEKETSKLRVVFDSAAKYQGVCLNDALEKGPNYTNSLFRCFLKWRMQKVAVCGDMSKMFNQIAVNVNDQRFHRFLWRNGELDRPIKVFQWLRVLFGDKPSPDLAFFAIKFIAGKHREESPLGADVLENNTYVDDIGYSVKSNEEANQIKGEIDDILRNGKFTVKNWHSNSPQADQSSNQTEVEYLGHCWNKADDTIRMKVRNVNLDESEGFTKRKISSLVAKIWDPFGYLLPVTIKYRIDLQNIWQHEYDWDQQLPIDMVKIWRENINQMQTLGDIVVKRCLMPENVEGKPQLHAFSDGGDSAYGSCIYIRWPTSDGIKITFVSSKAFVAPLKRKTIPRLELMAAVTMSRLVTEVEASLQYQFERKAFWIDSEVVLYWLNSPSCLYKPFVSTRIQEFQDKHPNWRNEVRYVSSEQNPADCLTKYFTVEELQLWYEGEPCKFLMMPEEQWPTHMNTVGIDTQVLKPLLEEKIHLQSGKKRRRMKQIPPSHKGKSKETHQLSLDVENAVNTISENDNLDNNITENFSSWTTLVKAVSCMKQIFGFRSFYKEMSFSPVQMQAAEVVLFFMCQKDLRATMDKTKQRFIKYNPSLSEDGLIRGKGRLHGIDVPKNLKYPVILPGENPIVVLYATYHHKRLLHQGYRVVLANLMNIGIMVGGGKNLLKSVSAKCFYCRIRRRKLLQQQMGNLPSFRIQVKQAPFSSVAIDFFGFLKIKVSRNTSINGSVMISVCMTTRCVHLELCSAIDTNSFLQAWRRFTTSRGVHPNHAFSDSGGAFKGAYPPIKEWIENWDHHLIETQFHQTFFEFNWKYNVPTASHMNGVVESLIRSVRKGLDASVMNYTKYALSYEHWSTVLSEVTYVVNSRPLFPDGDPWDFNCITGNDILHPYGQPNVPQFVGEEVGHSRKMFQIVQNKVDVFWKTWLKHLPPQLNNRNKWFHPRENLEVGDFVLLLEPGMKGKFAPRSMWRKAIVTETHPSEDGLVRSVTIKDSNQNTYNRPIHKLSLIATRKELENDA